MVPTFHKNDPAAPAGLFACEAAGLQWLCAAEGGARCVPVLDYDETGLILERIEQSQPTRAVAADFGSRLARTHNAGATAFGAPPAGWTGPGFFGPTSRPLPMSYSVHRSWGVFYAEERLAPMLQRAGRILTAQIAADVRSVIERCRAGDFDDADHPARLHGDLWGGNLLWTSDAVVLIDPAAHGGHRETDLAMLELFGCPHLDAVMAGYQSVQPLRPGRRDRVALHQLFPLLAHVVLFGSGYTAATGRAARAALEIS